MSYARTNYRDQSVTAGAQVPFVTGTPPAGFVPFERIFPTDARVGESPIWQAGLLAGLPSAAGSTLNINGVPTEYLLSRDAIFSSDFTGERERPAVNISLQWAPNDSSEYLFETFYNGYRNESFNSLLFSFADWWGNLGPNPGANIEVYPGTNIIKSRTAVGAPYSFTSGDLTTSRTDSFVYALGGKWDISDSLKLNSEVVYQTSEFETQFLAMRGDHVAHSIDVDFNSGGGLPAFQFADNPATPNVDESDQADANQWNMANFYDNADRDKGDAITFTLNGDYETGWNVFETLTFGVRYDDREASESQRRQDAGGCGALGAACRFTTYPGLLNVNDGFFDGRSDVPTTWVVADGYYIKDHADEFRALYQQINPNLVLGPDLTLVENFNVQEATTAAYLQTNFRTELGGHKLDGQFGARYVSVDTDMSFGTSVSAKASKLLPSLMVRYGITDDLHLRLAYGQTLRRPGFFLLNPNINYVPDVTNIGYGTASGGNPNLRPTESKNYDLSLEWYFAPSSALTATVFKREIEGFVVDFRRRVNFQNYDYILTQPDNASNGELEGLELGLVYFPENLPQWLDGIGFQGSFTWLDSTQDVPITNDVGDVVGTRTSPIFAVSDTSYSAVLAYEKPKYSARLSYVWREDFLNNYEAALFANPLGVYRKPEESMDLQLNYNVTPSFVVTLDATNLTDEIFQSYYENPTTNNFGSAIYSRTVALGVRFSF